MESPDVAKARGRAKASLVWGGIALGFGVVGLVALLAFSYVFLSLWGLIGGAVAIPFGLRARRPLLAAGLPAEARKGVVGAALGAAGVLVIVVSLAIGLPMLVGKHTVIMDHEPVAVGPDEGVSQTFKLTGGEWRVAYTVAGAASDSFTACLVPDSEVEGWAAQVSPTRATGQACSGPGSAGSGSARLGAGTYALAIYCWNTGQPCQLAIDLSADP